MARNLPSRVWAKRSALRSCDGLRIFARTEYVAGRLARRLAVGHRLHPIDEHPYDADRVRSEADAAPRQVGHQGRRLGTDGLRVEGNQVGLIPLGDAAPLP